MQFRLRHWPLLIACLFVAACTNYSPPKGSVKPAGADANLEPLIYVIRGFGNIFSLGMETIAERLANDGYYTHVWPITAEIALADEIADKYRKNQRRRPIVLLAHSMGGTSAFMVSRMLNDRKVPIDLIVTLDSTSSGPAEPNTRRVVNLYTDNGRSWAVVKQLPDHKGTVINLNMDKDPEWRDRGLHHFNLDKDAKVQSLVIREVKAALTRLKDSGV